MGGVTALALLLVALLPHAAYAWTPGTHVFLGDAVLRSLSLLPAHIADLLRTFPYDFLYGSIAADTSLAKKYVPTGRHCHSWAVGLEIHAAATDEAMRAFGLGYLAHLAADAIAHNHFVPMQLAVTASTSSLGHTYWESRFETHLGPACARQARDLILRDHSRADGLLDRILSPTIFSTQTNRRIFRGMVHAADSESWQRIFALMTENSRWDLPDAEVGRYLERSYDACNTHTRFFDILLDTSDKSREKKCNFSERGLFPNKVAESCRRAIFPLKYLGGLPKVSV